MTTAIIARNISDADHHAGRGVGLAQRNRAQHDIAEHDHEPRGMLDSVHLRKVLRQHHGDDIGRDVAASRRCIGAAECECTLAASALALKRFRVDAGDGRHVAED